MAAATKVRRQQEGEVMDEAALAQMASQLGLYTLPGSDAPGQVDLTEAEAVLLQEQGAEVKLLNSWEVSNPDAVRSGEVLFKVGTEAGKDLFQGTLQHTSSEEGKVKMWRFSDGRPRLIRKDMVLYYHSKRRLSPRPVLGKSDEQMPLFPCPGIVEGRPCPKKLYAPEDVEAHMKKAHNSQWRGLQDARALRRDQNLDTLLEAVASGQGSGNDINEKILAALVLLTERMGEKPAA